MLKKIHKKKGSTNSRIAAPHHKITQTRHTANPGDFVHFFHEQKVIASRGPGLADGAKIVGWRCSAKKKTWGLVQKKNLKLHRSNLSWMMLDGKLRCSKALLRFFSQESVVDPLAPWLLVCTYNFGSIATDWAKKRQPSEWKVTDVILGNAFERWVR